MLMYFMLGKEGIRMANYCDTVQTIQRHTENIDNNNTILASLRNDLLNKKCKKRYIYYLLLTDGYFKKKTDEHAFFPGHVVVFEKVPVIDGEPYYYMYQSYINQYDLAGHFRRSNNSIKMTHTQVQTYMNKLDYIMKAETWDSKTVKYWKDMTYVDTSSLQDTFCRNRFYICYKRATAKGCLENIKKYTKQKLHNLRKSTGAPMHIYGDMNKYDSSVQPLTNHEMKQSLEGLLNKLSSHKNNM
jgi:hypothetical protein